MARPFHRIILVAAAIMLAPMSTRGQDSDGGSSVQPGGVRPPAAQASKLPPAPKPTANYPGGGGGSLNARTTVNQFEVPWSAIGRLRSSRTSCTASLVAPALLLTAAHCVFNPQTRGQFPAQELHFMLGYSDGRYVAEAWGAGVAVSDAYDPVKATETTGDDWALVELDHSIGTPDRILGVSARPPLDGELAALGGYSQERSELLMVDAHCHVLGSRLDRNGVTTIHHNCTANHGVSGAPLLIREGELWVIGGVEAAGSSPNDGTAAGLAGVRAMMDRIVR